MDCSGCLNPFLKLGEFKWLYHQLEDRWVEDYLLFRSRRAIVPSLYNNYILYSHYPRIES